MIFYRAAFSTLWIKLSSNEQLGLLDSDYFEDFYGVDGQITLYHVDSSTAYPVLLSPLVNETPTIDDDVFSGPVSLAGLPNGIYEIRGRVRDLAGNYTILNAFDNPSGDEQVQLSTFKIKAGTGFVHVLDLGGVSVFGAIYGGSIIAVPQLLGTIGENLLFQQVIDD